MLRNWLGLGPAEPKVAETPGSSKKRLKSAQSESSRTPRENATPAMTPSASLSAPKHAWGGIVRMNTWPRTIRDHGPLRETLAEVHQPYSLRFEWPAGDWARWPGSGDYAFDSIRRAKKSKVVHGVQLRRLHESGICNLDEIMAPLRDYMEDNELSDVLAVLYYKRRSRWSRLDKLEELVGCERAIERLIASGALRGLAATEEDEARLFNCYSLLTVEELRMILASGMLLKEKLVEKAVARHHVVYPEAVRLINGNGFVALHPELYLALTRLHQYIFSACGLEPEDGAEFLSSGALCGVLEFARSRETKTASTACEPCWQHLKETLDLMGSMAHHVPRGNSDHVFRALHESGTLLLAANRRCKCWMSARVMENCLRMNSLGITLLERERRYEDALHYLRIALSALEGHCVVDLDAEEEDPSTLMSFHRARVLQRFCVDLGHLDRKNEALEELERVLAEPNGILWSVNSSRKTYSMNRVGGMGAGVIQLLLRLSEPPRRWRPKLSVTLAPFPEEHIKVKRVEGKRVENLAAEYYLEKGPWTNAQHCENGLMHTLFGLLFASDSTARYVFDDCAIVSNKQEISQIFKRIQRGEAPQMIREAWTKYHGKQMRGVNWERNTLEDLEAIVRNLGVKPITLICQLFVDAYKAWSGGLGDLLLWNDSNVRFVEIKGPGDSLSDRQRAWGEKLFLAGAEMAVCYVTWTETEPAGEVAPGFPKASVLDLDASSVVGDEDDLKLVLDDSFDDQ